MDQTIESIRRAKERNLGIKLSDLTQADNIMTYTHNWDPMIVGNLSKRLFVDYFPWLISSLPENIDSIIVDTNEGQLPIKRSSLDKGYESPEKTEPWTWQEVVTYHTEIINQGTTQESLSF